MDIDMFFVNRVNKGTPEASSWNMIRAYLINNSSLSPTDALNQLISMYTKLPNSRAKFITLSNAYRLQHEFSCNTIPQA